MPFVGLKVGTIVLIIAGYLLSIICAAIYVNKDAKKRNMNNVTWIVVTVVGPFLLGFIIYLVIREPIVEYQCPNCGNTLSKNASICSVCKTVIGKVCNVCGFSLNKEWKSCPQCGSQVDDNASYPVKSYGKDSSATVIIVIAAIVGVILFGTIFYVRSGNMEYSHSGAGISSTCGMYNITAQDLRVNEAIGSWMEECDKSDRQIHVLTSSVSGDCYVYVSDCNYLLECSDMNYSGDSEINLYIRKLPYDDKYGYDFIYFQLGTMKDATVNVYANMSDGNGGSFNSNSVTRTVVDTDISPSTWRNK